MNKTMHDLALSNEYAWLAHTSAGIMLLCIVAIFYWYSMYDMYQDTAFAQYYLGRAKKYITMTWIMVIITFCSYMLFTDWLIHPA
jgi:hypothetical protein